MDDFDILKRKNQEDFFPFISYVCFPHFKNLSIGARINFTYPITAIVGPNGVNKSSILRALQGAPNGYNIGRYWFETALDPIEEADNGKQRYYYGYIPRRDVHAEVMLTRVNNARRDDPDYFETDEPRKRDGMAAMPPYRKEDAQYRSQTRWRPVEKHVLYLDFRQELPAYDIYTSFNWRNQRNKLKDKKRNVRRASPHVKKALETLETEQRLYGANRILEPPVELDAVERTSVSKILGREYRKISLVKHDFFGVEGYTAKLVTENRDYSEAYAGSGEFAAIMLVHQLCTTQSRSLILLDEPETSLHPSAQRELLRFLAKKCKTDGHQVVMSTHAPTLIEELPPEAIKMLDIDPISHKVAVLSQEASPLEAFNRLGMNYPERTFLVEDELAAMLVNTAAKLISKDYQQSIKVVPVPGGAGTIKTRVIPVSAQTHSSSFVLLDGDMKPETTLRKPEDVPDNELESELGKIGISKKYILRNGGNDNSSELDLQAMRETLAWICNHVAFLPSSDNPDYLLLRICNQHLPSDPHDAKECWQRIAREEFNLDETESVPANQQAAVQQMYLARVIKGGGNNSLLTELGKTLRLLLPSL
ncbi:hypothetical protein CS006_10135 [Bifidobacterium primatium]|uniref:Endonuclease GajA/Old nuclease/RecF-like AAA domain-containing protein n=1 Tax=Bifidobacterium primatium TaxID=2045438 RepID=A0A2M9H6Q3_9BIFI|nr:ATP-binding protein [Bifidobacterium primatium]PJM72476.1 hypothetical protein CS006_10135 [Bifidobacterium primatium]